MHAPSFFPSSHLIVWIEVACRAPSAALAMVVKTGLAAAYSLLNTMATYLALLLLAIVSWYNHPTPRPFVFGFRPYP